MAWAFKQLAVTDFMLSQQVIGCTFSHNRADSNFNTNSSFAVHHNKTHTQRDQLNSIVKHLEVVRRCVLFRYIDHEWSF